MYDNHNSEIGTEERVGVSFHLQKDVVVHLYQVHIYIYICVRGEGEDWNPNNDFLLIKVHHMTFSPKE